MLISLIVLPMLIGVSYSESEPEEFGYNPCFHAKLFLPAEIINQDGSNFTILSSPVSLNECLPEFCESKRWKTMEVELEVIENDERKNATKTVYISEECGVDDYLLFKYEMDMKDRVRKERRNNELDSKSRRRN
ncbi:hypothetical protein PRIPAC_96941 [Pristionchus pacificus]|uniref:Uncharacterized protein n=1 Tax=Pristionchus pacificus TaxID=54126 RepID=A0A2A6D0Z0_PRIPA|nr:hypothetical protein PRIPAC_96941 [Pristionchus pacificus]|eukprot:PDM83951.1 hypothetical protein PRIPAC_34143 [Pristionchus pacificus]